MANGYALDASALMCLIRGEPGADRVETVLSEAVISAVNYAEVVAKIVERGGTVELAATILDPLSLDVVEFDRLQAVEAGRLRAVTRKAGLLLGDRACLALAATRTLTVLTADRVWAALALPDLQVEVIR